MEHWDVVVAAAFPVVLAFGALRQMVLDLEKRVVICEHEGKEKTALLMDIRERIIVIEQCVRCEREPKIA